MTKSIYDTNDVFVKLISVYLLLVLLGGFDQGLNIWGGENIELSLRTWMCGGRMVIHPCSRIAHVFKPFSYSFDGDKEKIIAKNSARWI